MVSPHPLPDRCGARITDKVGLEVTISAPEGSGSDSVALTDDTIRLVRLKRPSDTHVVVLEPEYEALREYLWSDFTAVGLAITTEGTRPTLKPYLLDQAPAVTRFGEAGPSGRDVTVERETDVEPDDDAVWLDLADVETSTTNRTSEHRGYCERYPMDNGRCYVHGGPSGGAPEGNTNAMTHGLFAQRSNYYQALEDEDQAFIESMVDSWIDDAPFDRDNRAKVNELYRIGVDQHRAWGGLDEFVGDDGELEGMISLQTVDTAPDGREIKEFDEHPVNLPYSRLDGDIFSKLSDLGILDDPDSQQADATESLAQALSGDDE